MRYAVCKKQITLYVVAVMAVLSFACASNPPANTSPEGQVAIKGRAVVKTAEVVLTAVDQAMTNGQLPTAVGLPIVKAIREIGVQGQTLADALGLVDAAKTSAEAATGKEKATAVLQTMQGLLDTAISPIKDPALKAQVGQLLSNLLTAIQAVRDILGNRSPAPDPDNLVALRGAWRPALAG